MHFSNYMKLKKMLTGNGKEINYRREFHARGVCDEIGGKIPCDKCDT